MLRTRRYRACRRGGSGPAGVGLIDAGRLLFAEADRFDLVFARAEKDQRLLHRVGTLLAEGDVVFAAAALVGVALDQHLELAVVDQELGVRGNQILVFRLDLELVMASK